MHFNGFSKNSSKAHAIKISSSVYCTSKSQMKMVAYEAWIKNGDPIEVICHEVKRLRPGILVVCSRCLGRFQRVFVGTVDEFCSKHADCAVIVVKRKLEDTPQDPVDNLSTDFISVPNFVNVV